MPAAVRVFTYVVPARYFVAVLKNVFLKGTSLAVLKWELLALAMFAVLVGSLATRAFRKSLG